MTDYRVKGYVVGQSPNPPLWAAVAGGIVALLAGDGSLLYGIGRAVFLVGLTAWAYLELSDGVNLWRRALGVAGLAFVLVSLVSTFS